MLYDSSVINVSYSNFVNYFLSDLVNLIFCIIILFVLFLFNKVNKTEFTIWSFAFFAVIPINFLVEAFNYFPDLQGYLICLRDIKEDLDFEYSECARTLINFDSESAASALGIFSLKRQIPAMLYFLIPIPSIANLSSIGFINKIILLLTYLFVRRHISDETNRKLLLFLFVLPTVLLYSSLGIRDNLIFCFSLIFLVYLIKEKFLQSLLVLFFLYLIKLQNALILSIPFFGIFLFKAHKNNTSLWLYFFCLFLILIIFQEQITEIINYFRVAFLNEMGLLSPFEVFEGFKSIWELILLSPFTFIQGLLSPVPTNPLNLIFFIESIALAFLGIYLAKSRMKGQFNFKLMALLFLTLYAGVVLNMFVVENQFTLLRYKYSFLNLFIIYLLFNTSSRRKVSFNI